MPKHIKLLILNILKKSLTMKHINNKVINTVGFWLFKGCGIKFKFSTQPPCSCQGSKICCCRISNVMGVAPIHINLDSCNFTSNSYPLELRKIFNYNAN